MAIKQDFNLSSGIGISADKAYLVNTTNSTSTSSGGLIVRGGAGIAKSLSLGGNLQLFNGSFFTSFISSATANTVYTLPATSPAIGSSVLQSTSDGVMSWVPMVATGGAASGFTTLNSLTSGIQYFSVGSSGSDFNISSSGSTHTFNIPIAGSGSTGLITTLAQTIAGTKTFTSTIIGDLSGIATTAGFATTSAYSYQSGYGLTAGLATTANYAYQSGYAITSGIATTATNINVVNATTNLAHPLIFSSTATGSGVALSSNTTLSYNPSTNILSTSGMAITATTASTSPSTGALTVAGGVGIAGTSYFGNDVTVGSAQTGRLYFSQGTLGSAGTTTNPSLMFVGQNNNPITLSVLSDNTLSFEGSSGQLFSINNNLSSGTIFSVNDISGIPIIRANANGTLSMGEFTGSVGVGLTNPSYKLHIAGDTNLSSGYVFRINGSSVLSATTLGTGVTNSSLTSVGTITTGVWAGTLITALYGGTGYNSYTKGDILVGAGSTFIKLNVGADNFVLTANSASATGLTWSPTAATGITTLNGLNAGIQNLAFGYLGSVPAFSSSGSTHTLNIPLAGSGSTGLISTEAQTIAGQKTFTSTIIGDLTGTATTANYAHLSGLAITSGFATTATYSYQSGYAVTSGLASTSLLALSISSSSTNASADYNIPFFSGTALSTNSNLYYNPSTGRLSAVLYTGSWAGNTITSYYGGTGYSTYSTGDLLVGAGTTLSKIPVGSNNFALVADSSAPGGVKWASVSGLAITNLNGLTASKQDLAFGYSGNVPAFSSSGFTHTLNIPLAGTGSTGLVSTQAQSFAGIKTFINAVAITDNTGSGSYTAGALTVTGGVGIGGTLNVQGDLNVQGTFTTINSTTINVADKNIELGVVVTPTDLTAEAGGITLRGATNKSINWYSGVGWSSSESWNLASGNTYKINGINVLSSNTLGTGVIFSSLQTAGIITSGTWSATAITALYGGTGLVPSFTVGDILYANTSSTWGRLAANSNSGYVLSSAGSGATPVYIAPSTLSVGFASTATYAYQSGYAITSGLATTSNYSHQSGYGLTSGFATTASYSHQSGYGITAGFATTANYANQSGYAITSGFATTASYSHQSGYAITAGLATTSFSLFVNSANSNASHSLLFAPISGASSGSGVSVNSVLNYNPSTNVLYTSGLAITAITASTSTSNGALQVAGGVGISGRLSFNLASFGTTGIATNPTMAMIGQTGDPIFMSVLEDNTISFEGSQGQLFSITPNLSTGYIYSVNDITGIPLLRANANANVTANEYAGNFGIGLSNPAYKLHVIGSVGFTSNISSTSTTSGTLVVGGGVGIGGSLYVASASAISGVTINNGVITGNLSGTATTSGFATTASYSHQSGYGLTSGFATTASYAHQSGYAITSGSSNTSGYATTSGFATTATYSYASGYGITAGLATTANYAHQSGYAITSGSSGFATTATYAYQSGYGLTSGFATTASYSYQAGYAITSGTASFATTANYAHQSGYGITAGFATTSSYSYQSGYAITSGSSGFATTANYSYQSGYGLTSGFATTANYALQSGYGVTAGFATTSSYSYQAGYAITSGSSNTSGYATTSGLATTANYSHQSGYGITAGFAITANYAHQSGYGLTSGFATTAAYSYQSGYGLTSGFATTAAYAHQSGYAITSGSSNTSGYATTSGFATTANYAYQSGYGITAGFASTSSNISVVAALLNANHPILFTPISGSSSGVAVSTESSFVFNPFTDILSVSGLSVTSSTAATNFSSGALIVTGGVGIGGSLFVNGDLTINGTTTTINSVTLSVDDKNIELGAINSPSDVTAEGGGITLRGSSDKSINWYAATGWSSSESWNLVSGSSYKINNTTVLSSSSLGTGVTNSSLTALGTITTGTWSGSLITAYYGGTGYNSYTKGDILVGAGNTFIKLNVGTNNYVLTASSASASGLTWSPTAATGITTLNSISSSFQYFATGYSGNEFNIASSGQTHTFNIPLAGTASTGLVSTGTQSFAGNKTFTGDVLINSSTASTNTSTGALRVNGGLGVSGQLSFGRASFGYTGINYNPSMSFIGNTSSSPITLTVLTDNSLSFESSSGQLFGIDNNLSTGEIFSVSDISGLPIISASAGQTITLNEFGGLTRIGNGTLNSGSTTSGTLIVYGGVGITGNAFIGGTTNITNTSASTSIGSGALTVAGGVGIGGSLYVSSATAISGVTINNGVITGNLTGTASTATYSHQSGYAITSGSSNTAGYATTSGLATTASNLNIVNASSGTFYPILSNTASSTSGIGASVNSLFSFNTANGTFGATSVNISAGQSYSIGGNSVLSGTSLGTGVTNSSLTALGTITSGTWSATAITALYGGTGYNSYTKGDILVGAGSTFIKVGSGSSNYVLSSNSIFPSGIGWTWVTAVGFGTVVPTVSHESDLWWNSEDGTLNYYYNDGDSSQWVEISNGTGLDLSRPVHITATNASTDISNGALIVDGGVGIGQSVSVGGRLQLFNGANYTAFVSSATGNTVYTLPATSPSTGSSVLQSTSAGVLSWVPMSSGSATPGGSADGSVQYKSGSSLGATNNFIYNSSTFELSLVGFPVESTSSTSAALKIEGVSSSFNGSLNGTMLAVNAPSSFTGDLINIQLNAITKFKVSATGAIGMSSSLSTPSNIFTGNGSFAKNGYGAGDILLDNGSNDTPGVLFYHGNNKNIGVDTFYSGAGTTRFRIVKELNETGGAELWSVDKNGIVTQSAWAPGEVIKMTVLVGSDLTGSNPTTVNSTSNTDVASYSYTPVSSSSYILIEFITRYEIAGAAADDFISRIAVNGAEQSYNIQAWINGAGGGTRSGTLFPLMARYTNSNTTAKTISVTVRRGSSDDNATVYKNETTVMKITEIGR